MLDYYQNLLKELKKQSRGQAILNWHKEKLQQMKLNLNIIKKGENNYVFIQKGSRS